MLKSLYIRNYALIDELKLEFDNGLSCLTGEAGAGKSILLGAIGLVLGERADLKYSFNNASKSIIEACFFINDDNLKSFFLKNDIDYDDSCLVRREITPQGKSRSFINDSPVNLQILKQLGEKILDVHTQYQKFSLSDNNQQLSFLDDFVDDNTTLNNYLTIYQHYILTRHKYDDAVYNYDKQLTDRDYNIFLLNELESAHISLGDYETTETELEKLSNSEMIKEKISSALYLLSENDESNIVSSCYETKSIIADVAKYLKDGDELSKRLLSAYIDLKDVADELKNSLDNLYSDPLKQQELTQRLDLLNNLMRKHKVNTIEELLEVKNTLSSSVLSVDNLADQVAALEKEKQILLDSLTKTAFALSQQRHNAAQQLSKSVSEELKSLGIPSNTFTISLKKLNDFTPNGYDFVDFLFSANVGVEAAPLFQVASGGELSRIMLALKSVIAAKHVIPTIIFDEIDSGISGVTASAVANKLKELSQTIQIIAITHLPQIAAKADNQFLVFKESNDIRTFSKVKLLSEDERINAIAAMISGDVVNQDAINNARFLVKNQ